MTGEDWPVVAVAFVLLLMLAVFVAALEEVASLPGSVSYVQRVLLP